MLAKMRNLRGLFEISGLSVALLVAKAPRFDLALALPGIASSGFL
jgi:hypothetical protein